jgi:photosystem II stability/assembly factor-like uncharacterized protein
MMHMTLRRVAVLGVLVVMSCLAADARAQTWVPVGPPGGDVRSLASDPRDPRRIYLGTASGLLYRSDDAGLRWHRMSPGFPKRGFSLDDIVVDSRGMVMVGYWEVGGSKGGVAQSVDGGKTFTILPGIEGHSVRGLTIAPSNPDMLVAGTIGGVFRSADRGGTWTRLTPEGHPDLRNVGSVAVDPRDPMVIYAGTWHLPWKSTDGGRSWFPISAGMIDDSDVMTLTVDRTNTQNVFATACSGIYRSTDGAARWSKVRGIPSSSRRTRAFAQSPDNQNLLFAGTVEGLWMSEDAGMTWRLATQKELVINSIVALPGGLVLLGTDGAGVVRSIDGGRSWVASNAGFSERFVSRMVFDRVGQKVLAGIWGDRLHGGVFAAGTPRGPWYRFGTGLEGREVLSLALIGSEVIAGTDDGLFLSAGYTGAWTRLTTIVDGVDAHPRVTDVVALSPRRVLAATSKGLLRTADGGRTWQRMPLGISEQISTLAVSPNDSDLVLAATPMGFFRSTDGGDVWTQISSGLGDVPVHSVAFVPTDNRVLFTATPQGLFRSADQGITWARATGGIPWTDITGLAIHPDGRTMYASAFATGGVFRSIDAGTSWERLPTEGLASERVWTLAVDPNSPERLLAASPVGGLHLLLPPAAPAAAAAGGQP